MGCPWSQSLGDVPPPAWRSSFQECLLPRPQQYPLPHASSHVFLCVSSHVIPRVTIVCPPVLPAPSGYCSFSSVSLRRGATCSSDGLEAWKVVGYIIGGCDQHRAVSSASSETPVAPATETLSGIPSMSRCALNLVAKIKKLFFVRKKYAFYILWQPYSILIMKLLMIK